MAAQTGYQPLVSTSWVAERLDDPTVRVIESNEDPLLYSTGHLPNAVEVDWTRDLNDPLRRDYVDKQGFSALMSRIGVTPETHLVFYGDRNNWWACYSLWVAALFGHTRASIMDGGRIKWLNEGREMTTEVPAFAQTDYVASERDDKTDRLFRDEVLASLGRTKLIDVRSPEEFAGTRLHMPDFPNEGALRGGHIPGAKNVPWARAVNPETGEFWPIERLREIYEQEAGLSPSDDVVAYCRIGERSSHTWFVLKHILGYPRVRNYDGSWTEWGNSVGVPIER
ncbi:MAG: sulfurtransferase [Fimbriimonadaceae bacterium]|nr:sulfurtransferase [Fimbriimonadaceae bacterium]QYK58659.1 MAG: sulfurtransferase [Fimbriimonadaceae bacterium]